MSNEEHDEWATGTGLSLAGADAEITSAVFGYNAKIAPDAVCLNLTFQPTEGGDPIEQSFSVGQGWEFQEKGDLLVAIDGRPRKINQNTNLGLLIDSIVGAGPFIDKGACKDGDRPFDTPRRASNWIGTKWSVDTHQVKRVNPTTRAEIVKDAYVFTAYLGKGEDAPKAAKSSSGGKGGATAAKSSPKAAPAAETYGVEDDDLRAALLTLAKEADDHPSFVEAAYAIDGVEGNAAVEKAIYAKKPGSLYAAAQE